MVALNRTTTAVARLDDARVLSQMAVHNVPGSAVALIDNAQIAEAWGYGVRAADDPEPVTPTTVFPAKPMSKLVTAVTALRLAVEKRLDLDADVNARLTRWRMPINDYTLDQPVTLRQLLSHQSGIVDPVGSFGPLKEEETYPALLDVLDGATRFHRGRVAVTSESGRAFSYSDAGYCVVQQVIEETTGLPFEVVAAREVFQPLGMADSSFLQPTALDRWTESAMGHDTGGQVIAGRWPIYPYPAAAGLWSTAIDLAKLALSLGQSLEDAWGGILPREMAWEMMLPRGCTDWAGLGVYVSKAGPCLCFFVQGWGLGSQGMLVSLPHLGQAVVVLANGDSGAPRHTAHCGEIVRGIAAACGWPNCNWY